MQKHQLEKEKKTHSVVVEKLQALEKTHQDTLVQIEELNKAKVRIIIVYMNNSNNFFV